MENLEQTTAFNSVTKPSVVMHALKYGLIFSGIVVLYSLLLYAFDLIYVTWLGFLGIGIVVVGVVIAILNYRDKINSGYISFGNAFVIGFIVFVCYSIISMIYSYVLTNYIDPELPAKMMQIAEEKLIEKGFSDEIIEQQLAAQEKFLNGPMKYLGLLIQVFTMVFLGALVSLICALILKKNDDSFKATFTS